MVTTTDLEWGALLCSQRNRPCQLPSSKDPFENGIVSELRVRTILIWLGMSSGPSYVWVKRGSLSGTKRFMKPSRSFRALGSAFSIRTRLQLVCLQNTVTVPLLSPLCFSALRA